MDSTVKDVMTTHVIWVRRNATYKDMAEGITAGDLMSSPAVTVSPDDTVAQVLAVFDRPDTEIRKQITGLILTEQRTGS